MTDRELFQRARKALPSLTIPLLGTLLVAKLGGDILPRVVFSGVFGKMEDIEQGMGPLLAFLGFWTLLGLAANLLQLGAARLCLNRGEGRPGTMPWTILPQWRRYLKWILWTMLLPLLLNMGERALSVWLGNRMTDMEFAQWNRWKSYGSVAVVFASLLFGSLLRLSVQTAYLRAPERGFWPAVGFGLREGLRKWPKTIGAQLKFVVPVYVGMRLMGVLLARLSIQTGGQGASLLCRGAVQILGLFGSVWIVAFSGHLAAERYAPPEERK